MGETQEKRLSGRGYHRQHHGRRDSNGGERQLVTPLRATEYETAAEMVDVYSRGGDILPLRLYLRGIGDGISMYNTLLQSQGQLHSTALLRRSA
jgi:hypothetical protein